MWMFDILLLSLKDKHFDMKIFHSKPWQAMVFLVFASFVFFIILHSSSGIKATNPPVVDFGFGSIFTQTNWDGGVGSSTSTQFVSATNIAVTTTGQIVAIAPTSTDYDPAWYDTEWQYRRQIVINAGQVSSTQTNFPVLITEANLDSAFFNALQDSNGLDIIFTDASGSSTLAREIVSVSTTAQTLEAYVLVPTITATTNTVIYVYYGNATTTQANSSSVWSNYAAVWHFEEDPSISTDGSCGGGSYEICDSSGNGNHANATNANFSNSNLVTGQIGNALRFIENPGMAGQILDVAASSSINNLADITLTFWLQGDAVAQSDPYLARLVTKRVGGSCAGGWEILYDDDANGYITFGNQPAIANPVLTWNRVASTTGAESITDDTDFTPRTDWHHVALTLADNSSDYGQFYIDGAPVSGYLSTRSPVGPLRDDSACDLRFGAPSNDTTRQLDATHDEVRIYPQTVSSSYIATEYNNHTNTTTFTSIGSAEQYIAPTVFTSGTLVSAIFDTGSAASAFGTVRWTTSDASSTQVRIRSSNDSGMSGAAAFSSCTALTQDQDISSNNCVTDGHRYVQYEVTLTATTTVFQDISFQSLGAATTTVLEGSGTTTIYVVLDEVSGVDVTIPYTISGSSTQGVDHNLSNGNIVVSAGQTFATTAIGIIDDALVE